MSSYESLPVVLVSAADITAAAELIAEIIDNEATVFYDNIPNGSDPVWRIVNKYYTADVRVHTLTDHQQLQIDPHNIEAHVVYLTNLECSAGGSAAAALAEGRQAGAGAAGHAAHVRLLAADCAEPAAELGAWAARRRVELVPLREAPASEEYGARRLRGALQAHTWRGLVRTDRAHRPLGARSTSPSESSAASGGVEEEEVEVEGASEEEDEESAEAFAAALGALAEARQERAGRAGRAAREGREWAAARVERVERAERVVAAFCRALGLDPHVC